ncbi:MAG: Hsp33 family molecular chaperone HslO [Verrucomicrobia bacterium]|nr:Hsp33 family molecular chaperone HslO [Verrucomicrobiota bacterium]
MTDGLYSGFSAQSRVRFTTVDVTEAARALELRHLAGPAAGGVLAQGLVAAALLSVDAARDDEAVYVRLKVSGPVEGVFAEASGNGDLRGFPHKKVLDVLDGADAIDPQVALGDAGSAEIVRTVPGKILAQSMLKVNPPRLDTVLARFFQQSSQVPTAVAIVTRSDGAGVLFARGIIAARMPDTESEAFVEVLEAFQDGRVAARLAESEQLETFRDLFQSPDLTALQTRELRFRCRCTKEKIMSVLEATATAELDDMLAEKRDLHANCHMCGQDYTLTQEELRTIRAARDEGADEAQNPRAETP